jgi:hypothetical protein
MQCLSDGRRGVMQCLSDGRRGVESECMDRKSDSLFGWLVLLPAVNTRTRRGHV